MNAPKDENKPGCPAGCSRCPIDQPETPGAMRGVTLGLAAAIFFLLPLATAIVGAVVVPLFWNNPHAQTVGGLAGLVLGLLAAIFIGAILRRRKRKP